jgi:hypothetical protein
MTGQSCLILSKKLNDVKGKRKRAVEQFHQKKQLGVERL